MTLQTRVVADGRFSYALDYDANGNLLYLGMARSFKVSEPQMICISGR